MCGRYALTASEKILLALFGFVAEGDDVPEMPPRYNIAPTQPIAVVRHSHGVRRLELVRWGLVPWWVEDPKSFSLLINARREGILDKPAFRDAMKYRRCLVPASGFYEWQRTQGKTKQPYWLAPADKGVVAFAGLYETWHDRASGAEIDSGCIVTTAANDNVGMIHDRMPAVIAPADFETWLTGEPEAAVRLLKPASNDLFTAVQVSTAVNKADNDGPHLIEPVAPIKTDLFGG